MIVASRIRTWTALAAALALCGCGGRDDSTVNLVAIGDASSVFDSGVRLSPAAQIVRGATVEGLVGLDEQGRVVPALADRWIVTDDGQSYIFRLRDGVWPDGAPITSESARGSLARAIAALKGTALALDLAGLDEIRVMAGRVIEIRLSRPMPNLLQLLAQPELGMAWNGKGSGPMRMTRAGAVAVLKPIAPQDRGLPRMEGWNDRVRTLRLRALPAAKAVAAFNNGEADVLLGGTIVDFPLASSLGISRGAIQLDPVLGLFGLIVVRPGEFLASPENREALAMAIDRGALISEFGVAGWVPSARIVSPGVEADLGSPVERWSGVALADLRAQASARVARWRAHKGHAPLLRLSLPDGPGSDILFDRLRGDFYAIGVDLRRVGSSGDTDLRLVDVVARYPRPRWFLNQLSCTARRGLCSVAADQRVAEAEDAPDATARAQIVAEAELELTRANVFIPFGPPIRWSLVRGSVTGFATNRWGLHPLMPMAMRPR